MMLSSLQIRNYPGERWGLISVLNGIKIQSYWKIDSVVCFPILKSNPSLYSVYYAEEWN